MAPQTFDGLALVQAREDLGHRSAQPHERRAERRERAVELGETLAGEPEVLRGVVGRRDHVRLEHYSAKTEPARPASRRTA